MNKKEQQSIIIGVLIAIVIIGGILFIINSSKNSTGNVINDNQQNCREEQVPYEEQEEYIEYESSFKEINKIILDTEGILWVDDFVIDIQSGEKMQWKVFCFDIPLYNSIRGNIKFNNPIWFMINDKEDVKCQTSSYTKEEGYESCGYDLGYAGGSSETYQSFDFGWTGNKELCLSILGHNENDNPITYDIYIENYNLEESNIPITRTRIVTKYKTENICD